MPNPDDILNPGAENDGGSGSAFVLSGGCRWNDTCVADVTMDAATGDPLTCKNPITGAELGGGGGGLETAEITLSFAEGVMAVDMVTPLIVDEIGLTAGATFKPGDSLVVPLYDGKATIMIDDPDVLTVSGDLELDAENYVIIVTGDGTINVTA